MYMKEGRRESVIDNGKFQRKCKEVFWEIFLGHPLSLLYTHMDTMLNKFIGSCILLSHFCFKTMVRFLCKTAFMFAGV